MGASLKTFRRRLSPKAGTLSLPLEGHFDQYEKQHDDIKRFGLSYLALQSFGGAVPKSAPVPGE